MIRGAKSKRKRVVSMSMSKPPFGITEYTEAECIEIAKSTLAEKVPEIDLIYREHKLIYPPDSFTPIFTAIFTKIIKSDTHGGTYVKTN